MPGAPDRDDVGRALALRGPRRGGGRVSGRTGPVPAGTVTPAPSRRVPAALRPALDDDRLARATWSRLAEPGDTAAARLVAEVGAVHRAGGGLDRARSRPLAGPAAGGRPRRRPAHVRGAGGRLLVPGDDEWPQRLADLDRDGTGERPRGAVLPVGARPVARCAEATARSAALVGARAATGYGEHVASELGAGLADRGHPVVSAAGPTASTPPRTAARWPSAAPPWRSWPAGWTGPTRAGNERLLERGSPSAGRWSARCRPGSAPTRWRFLERNRLIAALTAATVVVEAAWRSGALSTARPGRSGCCGPVGAVPGPVTSPASAGCHRLLRERGAVCVTGADEVAELLGDLGAGAGAGPPGRAPGPRRPRPATSCGSPSACRAAGS